ncbi:bifunctional phosphopantothenoylcysteine decarboxylase/phosphopantothenate--cysteine ligase CoaBC [Actinospongicola halichondriae]|uniref:bifunctional phosphopantothenoylcysteine decarboxylase/phosphopantothenate--cysteine ligase CoaBC n=1 Tax=Actinospongicola halichondriae TaxID=3236844 RepID=UPI003D446634
MLAGKRIVLGVTGGIAAYKAVEICRRLVDAGAHVSPIMTAGALRFVGETTFSALASEPVQTSLFDEASPIPHTRLGQNADLIIVAPATARLLSDYRTGRSDDLLTATLLATRAPVLVAPAMHTEMWEHPSVSDNLDVLRSRGVHVVPPEEGRLAGGDVGAGRLADPATVVARAEQILGARGSSRDLVGLRVLITAGGTREPIDPVRFIGNRSSGKQGFALAEEAAARGAEVTVVATVHRPVSAGIEVVAVETADEMHDAVVSRAAASDVVVMAAAVADFRPTSVADAKIKKAGGVPEVRLVPTVDILAALGQSKPAGQTLVGFAAETHSVRQNAEDKLRAKGADLIIANDVSAPGAGFEHDTNEVVILSATGSTEVPQADKRIIARAVLDAVVSLRNPSQEH